MNLLWFVRMARWARHPPSDKLVKLVFGVVLVAVAIIVVEWMGWWPDWATAEPRRR